MAEWVVEYQTHDWETVARFDPVNLTITYKGAFEPSTFSCEIALSDPFLTRDLIGPKRNDVRLWRDKVPVFDGELREVSLEYERDTLLCNHSDYKEYLNDRVYPFDYPWVEHDWPKIWKDKDLTQIALDILEDVIEYDPDHTPPFELNGSYTGVSQHYFEIDTADSSKILEHLKGLGDREDGFDIRLNRNDYGTIDLLILHPNISEANGDAIVYTITKTVGQITDFAWINKGPDGTKTTGLSAGYPNKSNAWQFKHAASVAKFRLRDNVKDFGQIRGLTPLKKLTAAENHRALFPQKELQLGVLLNDAHYPRFWDKAINRPESLVGRRIWVGPIDFYNYHRINAAFEILDMTIEVDADGNEFCDFGLEMIDG